MALGKKILGKSITSRVFIIFGAFAIILTLAYYYASSWHPSDDKYPTQGIDVSNHQGVIQWQALPSQGVDFAYIKSTEGGDFVDKSFSRNWHEAHKAGIPRGAYHFFTLCKSGVEQAKNYIRTVPFDPAALPPVVDLEYLGNCSRRVSIDLLHKELNDFITAVEAHYGKPIVLYLTQEFDDNYQVTARVKRKLWLRSIILEPNFGKQPWHIWQMSNFRRLDGISGRVDWNARH
jgi:lysozyme